MAAAKKEPAKGVAKRTAKPVPAEAPVRKRKIARYKSFRLQKKISHPAGPLPGVRQLLRKTGRLLWANKRPLLVLVALYFILNLALVRNFTSPLNVGDVKEQLNEYVGGDASRMETTAAIFGQLVTTGNETSSGLSQAILLVVFGLAIVWLFRQSAAGNAPTAKEALYKGMYPLVPFLLILFLMFLEFLPAIIGSALYGATVGSGIAATGFEVVIWTLLASLLVILTLYLLFSSLFSLFVVTLPDVTPLKALRSARQLVFSRRPSILLRLLILPLLFILVLVIIVVPAIYFAASFAPWLYFLLSIFGALFVHAYLFTLYKELL
jgi:hypothetical protein